MKLDNKTSYEMTAEIVLTDTELEAVQGGWGGYPAPSGYGDYGSGYPSDCGGSPSYGGGSPSYGGGYPSYAPHYGNPFDTGSCSGNPTTYSVTTTTYSVSPAASNCGGY
jgi:hypothetical protein